MIHVAAAGDLAFLGALQDRPDRAAIEALRSVTADADLFLPNLETVLTDIPDAPWLKLRVRSAPGWADLLAELGVRYVNLANNHCMDFGTAGLKDTLAALNAAGIRSFGAGMNSEEARAPLSLNIKGLRVAVLGRSDVHVGQRSYASDSDAGVAKLDIEADVAAVEALKKAGDPLVIFVLHWGLERYRLPSQIQRDAAARLTEAGVDLIVGHHPHVLQPVETIQNRLVAYSLGNCVFGEFDWQYQKNQESDIHPEQYRLSRPEKSGAILHAQLHHNGSRLLRLTPTRLDADGYLHVGQGSIGPGLATRAMRLPAYDTLWRAYSYLMEFKLRFLPLLHDLVRQPHKLRARHITSALDLMARSAKISAQKTTNPYDT